MILIYLSKHFDSFRYKYVTCLINIKSTRSLLAWRDYVLWPKAHWWPCLTRIVDRGNIFKSVEVSPFRCAECSKGTHMCNVFDHILDLKNLNWSQINSIHAVTKWFQLQWAGHNVRYILKSPPQMTFFLGDVYWKAHSRGTKQALERHLKELSQWMWLWKINSLSLLAAWRRECYFEIWINENIHQQKTAHHRKSWKSVRERHNLPCVRRLFKAKMGHSTMKKELYIHMHFRLLIWDKLK